MDVPDCNVCHVALDEDEHQPRHLGCSHDACTTCVKALIKNGSIMCPMCRTVVKANTHDDLKINHGVVQILRMFKGLNVSVNKAKVGEATANIKGFCRIHELASDSRCATCKVWICTKCKEFHTSDIGCKIQDYNEFLRSTKKEHKEKVEPTLTYIRKDITSLTSELSNLENEKKKIEKKIENLQNSIEDGKKTLDKCVAATKNVEEAGTSMELNEYVNISNEWHQFAQIWRKKNTDNRCRLIEELKSNRKVYTSSKINGKSLKSKMAFENGNMYLHCFKVDDGSSINGPLKIFPYVKVLSWLPSVRDQVFLDLAIAGQVKGRVTIHLRQDLTNYAKYIPLMFTGEEEHSLLGMQCRDCGSHNLGIQVSTINNKINKFARDNNAGSKSTKGSILADWSSNVIRCFYICFERDQTYGENYEWFGQVDSGLDIVKLCRNHNKQSEVTVIDCGIVIKEDALGDTITNK